MQLSIKEYVDWRNDEKILFTAGPTSLLVENLIGIQPCFGRGDNEYRDLEEHVLNTLKGISGHQYIARLQGSGTLALEIGAANFLSGDVLVISTGYYSDRLTEIAKMVASQYGNIAKIDVIDWKNLDLISGKYDWMWACPVETSMGLLVPISKLYETAKRVGARLMLDATASIGLEGDHNLADVITYSSCKGLFGLVGACFVAFNESASNQVNSFYMDIKTHLNKGVTGPYHAITSLAHVLPNHFNYVKSVENNKKKFLKLAGKYLVYEGENQPKLCTQVKCRVLATDPRVILYSPRNQINGSVVCHLGEAHLGATANGEILKFLTLREFEDEA